MNILRRFRLVQAAFILLAVILYTSRCMCFAPVSNEKLKMTVTSLKHFPVWEDLITEFPISIEDGQINFGEYCFHSGNGKWRKKQFQLLSTNVKTINSPRLKFGSKSIIYLFNNLDGIGLFLSRNVGKSWKQVLKGHINCYFADKYGNVLIGKWDNLLGLYSLGYSVDFGSTYIWSDPLSFNVLYLNKTSNNKWIGLSLDTSKDGKKGFQVLKISLENSRINITKYFVINDFDLKVPLVETERDGLLIGKHDEINNQLLISSTNGATWIPVNVCVDGKIVSQEFYSKDLGWILTYNGERYRIWEVRENFENVVELNHNDFRKILNKYFSKKSWTFAEIVWKLQ